MRLPRHYFSALYPIAFRSFDLAAYDLVLSCSTFAAKAVSVGPRTVHVCYCNTPPRFLWGFDSDTASRQMPSFERPLAQLAKLVLRPIDHRAAQRVNLFVANSRNIADRIRAAYGRDAQVVHPPVDTARFAALPSRDDGFLLIVSRLNAYKRIDYVIDACNARGLALVIAGTGPWEERLRARAGATVRMLGAVSDTEVDRLMSTCTAFVLPGEEDFGIAAVEAMAAGKPVLALRRGGAVETVVDGVTGVLYDEPTPESFLRAHGRACRRALGRGRITRARARVRHVALCRGTRSSDQQRRRTRPWCVPLIHTTVRASADPSTRVRRCDARSRAPWRTPTCSSIRSTAARSTAT